jgi:hypothetical protein
MDAAAGESIVSTTGYPALLRKLRNFDQTGVIDAGRGGRANSGPADHR